MREQSHQIEMQPSSLKQINVAVDNVDVSSGAEEVVSVTRETAQWRCTEQNPQYHLPSGVHSTAVE